MSPDKKESTPAEGKRDYLPKETRDHLRQARSEMRQGIETLLPPEFVAHRRAARRELLLAAQSLIQHALERLEA